MKNPIPELMLVVFLLWVNTAFATQSTINTTIPVQGAPLQSAPIRNNFIAAYNDINNLYGLVGTGTRVSSINGASGGFTFNGNGVSCTSTTCTFNGLAGGSAGGDLGGTYPNPTVLSVGDVTTGTLLLANGGTSATTATGAAVNLFSASGSAPYNPKTPYFTSQSGSATSAFLNSYQYQNDPVLLPNFRKCLANIKTGVSRCRILIIGDSTSYGYGSQGGGTDVKTYSWPAQFAKSMSEVFGVPSDYDNFIGDSSVQTNLAGDPRLTQTNWSDNSAITVGGGLIQNTGQSGTLTFAGYHPTDHIKFYHIPNTGNGTIGFQIDAGSVTQVNDNTTAALASTTLTASLGIHKANVTWVSGGSVYSGGFEAWDSTHPGFSIINSGIFGATTASWLTSTFGWSPGNNLSSVSGDLNIIDLDLNDAGAATSLTTYKSNLHTLITDLKNSGAGDVVLMTSNHATDGTHNDSVVLPYIQAIYQQAAADNVPVIDNWSREVSGTYTSNASWLYTDNLHMNAQGYGDFAQGAAMFLYSVVGAGSGLPNPLPSAAHAGDLDYLEVFSAASGSAPTINAYGPAGSNVGLGILPQGTGGIGIGTTSPVASLDLSQKTDALALPSGTTAQRPSSPVNGEIRYNTDQVGSVEGYVNGGWTTFVNYDGTNNKNINVQDAPYWASGYLAQTTTNGSNASGQLVINVKSTTGFNTNQIAIIYQGGSSQTTGHKNFACTIASIVANTSLTCSGTAVTGNGLPTYAPSSSGTTLTTTVPANYMVFSVGTTTMSAASNGATSITLGNATGYLVNQGIMIYGGATSGANLVTQITAVSGNVLTISPGISNASGVASGTYVQHDDTAAIQAAVNVASYNQNVDISVPDGYYQINGAPSGTGSNQINLPNLNYFVGCCGTPASTAWWPQATITIHGFTPATQSEGYLAGINLAPMTGAIFESQDTTAGASMLGAYSSASLANMTNIQLVVKNIIFRSYPNPQSTMLNGNYVQEMSVYNSSFDTGETSQTTQPTTNSNNSAIIGPGGDNGGNNVFSQLEIYGYYWGIQSGEHTRLEHIRFDNDLYPWLINTSTGPQSANYGATAVDLQFNGCPHGIASYGGAGTNVDMSLINIEHQTSPSWVTNVDDINDSSNLLWGFISIDSPLNSNTQTVTGGANLHIVNARSASYPISEYTYSTLPSGVPNMTLVTCSNCTVGACATSGNGSLALKVNGSWVCK